MGQERIDVEQAAILECHGCRTRTVVIEEKYVSDHRVKDGGNPGGTINYRGVWWWPPPGVADLDVSIPTEVADAFREGVRAMSAQAPHAAAVMFRRTLEAIVKTTGSAPAKSAAEKTNLATGLKVMADEGALDKSLAEWAKTVRIVANFGAHYDVSAEDITMDEAEDLSRLVREMLRFLYEMPARVSRSRGASQAT
jgi:hypothetical protein